MELVANNQDLLHQIAVLITRCKFIYCSTYLLKIEIHLTIYKYPTYITTLLVYNKINLFPLKTEFLKTIKFLLSLH